MTENERNQDPVSSEPHDEARHDGVPRGTLASTPRRLGEFRLLTQLGAGGMGIVYLAEQESLSRRVALKVIRPAFAASPASRARFQREVAAVAKLRHPNIVAVHTAGEQDGVLFLAMDLVEGEGLDERIDAAKARGATVDIDEAVRHALDVARALDAAHRAGIVHRDVKPSNIRVTPDGRAMLLDFGLARDQDSARLTLSGEIQGSPYYLAPETIRGQRAPDPRSDVYALGVTLYECLTGNVPFQGETFEVVMHRILFFTTPPPRRANASLSRDLETVVMKALEKDPNRRYASAAEFAEDLEAILDFRPIRAKPPGALSRALRFTRRRPGVAASLLGIVAVIAVIAGMTLARELERRAAANERIASARRLASADRVDEAREALSQALAFDPDHAGIAATRGRIADAGRRREAAAKIEAAKERAAQAQARIEEWSARRVAIEPLVAARNARYVSPQQLAALDREELAIAELERGSDADEASIVELTQAARALLPEVDGSASAPAAAHTIDAIDALLARFYLLRFLASEAAGDARRAAYYDALCGQHDRNGSLATERRGDGRLALTVEPAGAEVHLFRYVDQASLAPNGERRLVPVPFAATGDWKPPRPYGAWVLVAVGNGGGLARGEHVLSVAGHPIREVTLVLEPAGELRTGDRLLSIDGQPVRDPLDARFVDESRQGERSYVFERRGGDVPERIEVTATGLAALDVELASPAEVATRGGVPLEIYRDGFCRPFMAEPGADLRPTAAPLYLAAVTRAGTAPIADLTLPPGSYLAVVRRPEQEGQADRDTMRLPFVMPRQGAVDLRLELPPVDFAPPTFRPIAGGSFVAAIASDAGLVRTRVDLAPFWMMEREVTFGDWLEFLNDDATPDSVDRLRRLDDGALLPRLPNDPRGGALVTRGEDGRFECDPAALALPVHGLRYDDAREYAAWRTARERAAGRGALSFDLPTAVEWERAARGADDRVLVCGDHFNASWIGSKYARPRALIEPAFSFPVDESPFGIYDLGGGLNEWVRRSDDRDDDGQAFARGGAFDTPVPQAFAIDALQPLPAATRSGTLGFRLVARLTSP
jgi:formylglycine-generating enzyme required for sulfatase activity